MPAKSTSNMNGYWELPHKIQLTSEQEVHIYLYNRVCALEQRINQLQTIIEEQCNYCQYKKVAENIKTMLS